MSVFGVGASGSVDPNAILLRMLSRLDPTSDPSPGDDAKSQPADSASAAASTAGSPSVGQRLSKLSDRIMAFLVMMSQQSAGTGPAATNAAFQPGRANGDAVHQLFGAMDTNGDGVVSQSEMESYIQSKGGTQAQADTLFSALNGDANGQNGPAGLTEDKLAADIAQAGGFGHHHHHPDSGDGAQGANASAQIVSRIFNALDTNKDGVVSAEEFAAALGPNANGAPGADANANANANANDPAAQTVQIQTNSDGSINPDQLGQFLTSLAQQIQSDATMLSNFMQLALKAYNGTANPPGQGNDGQSAVA